MSITLIINNKDTKPESITFDASPSQDHNFSSKTTDYPVEDGFNLSDSVINEPDTLNIKGFFSALTKKENDPFPHISAFKKLYEAKNKGISITAYTSLMTYENMIITSLSVPIEVKTGDSFFINVSLKECRTATAKTSKVIVKKKIIKEQIGKNNSKDAKQSKITKALKNRHTPKVSKGLKPINKASGANLTKVQNTTKQAVKPSQAKPQMKSWAVGGLDSFRKSFGF